MSFPLGAAAAARLDVVPRTGSTNADLRDHADDPEGWPHLSTLLTRHQTAGRGRLDRTWEAPDGAALAISVLLRRVPTETAARGWIPLVAGVAMAEAVEAQLPGHDVAVKWPNDVLVDGLKICGVLAEATTDAVIVGAGVNTDMTARQLPVPTATSFATMGAKADEDRLLADYLRGLERYISSLAAAEEAMTSGVHAVVTARCATLGRTVRVTMPSGDTIEGVASALDPEGRLRVSTGSGERAISAGDVVHVRPA
ncbi:MULTISPECIES: biotin--[acetyl-CoA-carboxylase] ligase [unclassified Microbacterium]|uniref:biotin--[acetyl-CoA-carboxylase] ligase n=1 Tax=unclassified Microbacterium TaxID=2609290 RepID=UPI000EAACD5F|nr:MULTISPECIES: biotin--[acetyl-CoA-carboxylase] ligase [unclassified Microbacterium]MBT2485370.1 biotin--[acetyl-CoA-carboxylase] ligase [Microbacterium sp. ISL-108]RKN68174.1 biotin--[acetyl-CoA-carboxylase] ligase [Microbacterium sp. CGR2]